MELILDHWASHWETGVCSITKWHKNKSHLKMFLYKKPIFCWYFLFFQSQWVMGINGGYFLAIFWVCFINAVLKFLTIFCKMFQCFLCWILLYLFFICSNGRIFVSDDSLSFLFLECWTMKYICFLIAALIFSAGYYSAPIFFLLRRIKKCFALPHFAAFSTFCVKSFWLLKASFSLLSFC